MGQVESFWPSPRLALDDCLCSARRDASRRRGVMLLLALEVVRFFAVRFRGMAVFYVNSGFCIIQASNL